MTLRSVSSSGGDRVADPTKLSAQRRRVGSAEGLPMVLGLRDDDAVDQYAGDLHLARTQAAALGDPLHLHDHQAAGVVHRGRHGQRLQRQRLALHGDVPLGIRGGAAQEGHIELEAPCRRGTPRPSRVISSTRSSVVRSLIFPPPCRGSTKVPSPTRVSRPGLPAAVSRKSCEMVPCGRLCASILLLHGHLPQLGRQGPMATHGSLDQALVAQAVQPATLPVAWGDGKHQREVAGGSGVQETLLQRERQLLGETLTHEPLDHDRSRRPGSAAPPRRP